jgi:hypothetical protein
MVKKEKTETKKKRGAANEKPHRISACRDCPV